MKDTKINIDETEKNEKIIKINNNECELITVKLISEKFPFKTNNEECYPSLFHFELFITEHPNGYFKDLLNESARHDPRKIGANMSATRYDYNDLHSNTRNSPCFVWMKIGRSGAL